MINLNNFKVFDYEKHTNTDYERIKQEKKIVKEKTDRVNLFFKKFEYLIKKEDTFNTNIFTGFTSFASDFLFGENKETKNEIPNKIIIKKQVEFLSESVQKINELCIQISDLNKKLSEPLDPIATREILIQLYEAENKFSKAYLNFTIYKSSILGQLTQILIDPQTNIIKNKESDNLKKDLQTECEESQETIKLITEQLEEIEERLEMLNSQEWVIKAKLEQLHEPVAQINKELIQSQQILSNILNEQYLLPLYSKSDEHLDIIQQNENSKEIFYKNIPSNENDKNNLEELQKELNALANQHTDKLKAFATFLSDRIKVLPTVNEEEKKETENFCKRSSLELLMIQQDFEKKSVTIIHRKQQILRDKFQSQSLGEEKFKKYTEELRQELSQAIQRLKTARNEIYSKKEMYATELKNIGILTNNEYIDPLEDIQESETWAFTPWGQLILPSPAKEMLSNFLGMGFQTTIDDLKKERRDLKLNLKQTHTNPAAQKEIQTQLNEINIILYHTLLQRIIDVIGEKQKFLKNDLLSSQQKIQLKLEIDVLNHKYHKLLSKYENTPVAQKSFMEANSQRLANLAKSLLTLGYFNGHLLTPEELKYKKHYADLGYDMMNNLSTWLEDLQMKPDESVVDVLKREVEGFLVWADKHPRTAVNLVADIALTCSVIGDKSYVDQFIDTMKAKAYTAALSEGWSIFPLEDPLETPEELKYRALADLFRCAPIAAAIIRPVFANQFISLQKTFFDTGFEVLKVFTAQQVQYFIPAEYARIALSVLQIVKGESFQKILEEQRNIELARLGGVAIKALANPEGFLSALKLRLKLWSKTLVHCTGWEKVARITTQIIIPSFGVIAIGGLSALVIMGGPITWISAATMGAAIFSGCIATAQKTNQFFNGIFPAYQSVLKEIEENKQQTARKNIEAKITEQREKFIQELKKKGSLPKVSDSHLPPLTDEQKQIYQTKLETIIHDFENKLNKNWEAKVDKTAVDCIQLLTKQGFDEIKTTIETFMSEIHAASQSPDSPLYDLSKALSQETDGRQFQAAMADEIINTLIKDWLNPHIDLIFTERALREGQGNSELHSQQPKNPDDIIREEFDIIREELKKEFPNIAQPLMG